MSATSILGGGSQTVHQFIDGRVDRVADLLGQMRVKGRGVGRGMAEDVLNHPQIDPRL